MRTKWLYVLFSLVVMLLLSACGDDNEVEAQDSGDSKDLIIAQPNDVETFDPQDALSTSAERVLRNMYSRLFINNEDMEAVPDLVESYENIDDETWHFELKSNVTFHNGDDLTAEDVKFSLERVMEDETLKEYPYFKQLKEINVLDDHEVEIITDGPMPTIEYVLAKSGSDIMPKDYIEEVGMEEFSENPIGSGPYQLVERKIDDKVVLEKYEDYFGEEPTWDTVTMRTITENSTRVGELLTGEVDLITDVPANEQDRIEQNDNTSVLEGDSTRVALLMNRMTEGYATADPKGRYPQDSQVAELIVSMLGEVDIEVKLELLEGGSFSDFYNNHENEELIMIALADGLLEASYSLVHYTIDRAEGQTDYHNEEVDQLYKDATRNLDEDERIKQYQEIQQIVAEDRPHTFLYQNVVNYGSLDTVEFEPRIDENIYFDHVSKN